MHRARAVLSAFPPRAEVDRPSAQLRSAVRLRQSADGRGALRPLPPPGGRRRAERARAEPPIRPRTLSVAASPRARTPPNDAWAQRALAADADPHVGRQPRHGGVEERQALPWLA
ncbi:MAG: hypothetical protein RMJ48_08980 [Roseiflexaceae bacterium]|nr:hypothetical protein [Roseiflexaceae bacterium]